MILFKKFEMNDTLDYFATTQIDHFISENLSKTQPLKSDELNDQKDTQNSISFDDSIFLDISLDSTSFKRNESTNSPTNEILSNGNSAINSENEILNDTFDEANFDNFTQILSDNSEKKIVKSSLKSEHSQPIQETPQVPLVTTKNYHLLSSWGLPETVLKSYEKRNVTSMFDWQLECLSKDEVIKKNRNLVYSAPTSAGKTLVAEILAMKCLFERKKKVLFILPFISVVREKMYYFQDILSSSGKRVEGFMGSYNPPGGFQPVQMAIGTIEKCNSLVNRLLEENKLEDIGMVIIDEFHLIGDPHRGYLLELLLTKLKYVMSKNEKVQIQVVGMSATLPNLDLLARWLNAELYTTDFRPIPLHEMVYVNKEIYNKDFKLLRKLPILPELASDTDDILQLCLETIENECSVLIFCPTRNWCENLAQQIAMAFWRIGKSGSELGQMLRRNLSVDKITEILEQLKYCPSGMDKILKNTVAFGVAFHHAGLTMEERDIIEGGFRSGGLKLLIATSTLSSGVNLPARRVIIRSPLFNGKPIDILTYRQMIGRAGRMGIDTEGQSILVCQKSDYSTAKSLTQSTLKPVQSCLEDIGKFKRAILEIIASGVAASPDDIDIFEKSTLISIQNSECDEKTESVSEVVEYLKNFNFIRLQTMEDGSYKYMPTALGKACLSSSLPPGEGLELFTELEKARRCFVLETELHLIYIVTPYSACYQWSNIDWMFYLDLWEKLPLTMKKVGELVGVRESFIVGATRGSILNSPKLFIHKRFFVALALQDLVNEKPLDEVAAKFNCNRGLLQSLQQSASTFAGMVTAFSRQLGWSSVEILISQFQDRLQFGVNRDLLDLMRLPCLNGKQARAFHNAGIETLIQLANSNICTIENILHKVVPFENIKEREGETEHEFKQRNKLRTIWITGKQGVDEKEAAQLILSDCRQFLEHEMGVQNVKWGESEELENCQNEQSFEGSKENSIKSNEVVPSNEKFSVSKFGNCGSSTPKINKTRFEECENKENSILALKNFENLKIMSPQKSFSNDKTCTQIYSNKKPRNILCDPKTDSNITKSASKNNNISIGSLSEDDLFQESLEETIDKVSTLTVDTKKRLRESNVSPLTKKQKTLHENTDVSVTDDINETPSSNDLSKFYIVDVCKFKELYESFSQELLYRDDVALSLACREVNENTPRIGINIDESQKTPFKYQFQNRNVDGISFTWDGKHVFYLYLENDGCDEKIKLLQKFLEKKKTCTKMFDSKECIVMLSRALGLEVSNKIEDPLVVDWLLEPDGKEKSFHDMISQYCPDGKVLLELVKNCKNRGSLGMMVGNTVQPKMRSAIETVILWNMIKIMKQLLIERSVDLLHTYEVEMAVSLSVSKMEIVGIGVDMTAVDSLFSLINTNARSIEKKIYSLAGRKFSITSKKEIAKIIGLGSSKKTSTKKQILEQSNHPIAELILLWRKLSGTLCKMLQPLVNTVKNNRIYGKSIMHTSTGRISMHEPNIQNIAKDFDFVNPITNETILISCRSIFVPSNNHMFLSADFCQLELRMLAHLSGDELLCGILSSEGDIFKSITAKWNRIPETSVTTEQRNQTKQICYGIIYGIGGKSLAEQLKVEVEEASLFMENFKNTYPGIKKYIQAVIDKCRTFGYIQTLAGRRRNLPLISSENQAIKSHAERQAVNSTIQGSAADLVKKAMKKIEENFEINLRTFERPHLVLHLHDELLFEVDSKYLKKVAKLVKDSMESAVKLSVPFPVKLKTGTSWGSLMEKCDIF